MDKKMHELAQEMSKAFTRDKRADGSEFVHLKDDSPDWMTNVIRESHGDSFPDDTIYRFIEKAVDALADADADADPSDVIAEIEPDVYTGQLTAWLHEQPDHVYYLTQVMEEGLGITDGFQLLAAAQKAHIDEVAYAVVAALQSQVDDMGDPAFDIGDRVKFEDDPANSTIYNGITFTITDMKHEDGEYRYTGDGLDEIYLDETLLELADEDDEE